MTDINALVNSAALHAFINTQLKLQKVLASTKIKSLNLGFCSRVLSEKSTPSASALLSQIRKTSGTSFIICEHVWRGLGTTDSLSSKVKSALRGSSAHAVLMDSACRAVVDQDVLKASLSTAVRYSDGLVTDYNDLVLYI